MAPRKRKQAAKGASLSASSRWIIVQTLLLVGLGKETLEWLVLEQAPFPPVVQVLLGMVVVTGTLGGVAVLAERRLRRSLSRTHKKVHRRYRVPVLLLHGVALVGIFLAYAAFWNEETGALDEMAGVVWRGWEAAEAWAAGGS